jgi:uncharacterized protein YlxW (UPF0749 family)
MEEDNVLRHLLELEAEAAGLVDGAQAEADKRLSEGEKENRARYDQRYGVEAAKLDAELEQQLAQVRADYQKQIDAYHAEFDSMSVNTSNFNKLAGQLLFRK